VQLSIGGMNRDRQASGLSLRAFISSYHHISTTAILGVSTHPSAKIFRLLINIAAQNPEAMKLL
jgi:hypothetical protein